MAGVFQSEHLKTEIMSEPVTLRLGQWPNTTRHERDGMESDLRKHVFGEKFGKIVSCRVMMNNAYIELSDKESALKAIKELTGVKFRKRKLWVKLQEEEVLRVHEKVSRPASPRLSNETDNIGIKIHIGDMNVHSTDKDRMRCLIRARFEEYGTVGECSVFGTYGFVKMPDREQGLLAIEGLNNTCIGHTDQPLSIKEAKMMFVSDIDPDLPVKLHVTGLRPIRGLPDACAEIKCELQPLFAKFGRVTGCTVLGTGTFGFVHMEFGRDGIAAVRALDGTRFLNSLISVQLARPVKGDKRGPKRSECRSRSRSPPKRAFSPKRLAGFNHGDGRRQSPPRERQSPPRDRRSPPRDRRSPPRDRQSPPRDRQSPPRDRRSPPRDRRPSPRDRKSPPRFRRSPPHGRRTHPLDPRDFSRSPIRRYDDRLFHHGDREEDDPRNEALPEKPHVVSYDVEGNPIHESRVRTVRGLEQDMARGPKEDMAGARPAVARAGVARTAEAHTMYAEADPFHREFGYDQNESYDQQYDTGYYDDSHNGEKMHSGGLAYAQDMYAAPGNSVSHMQPAARRLVRAVGPRVVKAVTVPRKAAASSYTPSEYEEHYDAPLVGRGRSAPMVGRGQAAALPGRVAPLVGRGRAAPPPGRVAPMVGRGRTAPLRGPVATISGRGRGLAIAERARALAMAERARAAQLAGRDKPMAGWSTSMPGQSTASGGQEGLAQPYDDSWQYDDPQQHYADPSGGYY